MGSGPPTVRAPLSACPCSSPCPVHHTCHPGLRFFQGLEGLGSPHGSKAGRVGARWAGLQEARLGTGGAPSPTASGPPEGRWALWGWWSRMCGRDSSAQTAGAGRMWGLFQGGGGGLTPGSVRAPASSGDPCAACQCFISKHDSSGSEHPHPGPRTQLQLAQVLTFPHFTDKNRGPAAGPRSPSLRAGAVVRLPDHHHRPLQGRGSASGLDWGAPTTRPPQPSW